MQPYQLVKDERTRYETGNVQAVLDGDVEFAIEGDRLTLTKGTNGLVYRAA